MTPPNQVTDETQTQDQRVQDPPEVGGQQGPDAPPVAQAPEPQAEIARLQTEKAELNDRLLRLAADFDNYKKRVRREMEEAGLRGLEALLKELLPVLDNLDRALEAGDAADRGSAQAQALLEGVRLVQRQFLNALEKFQVRTFEVLGKPFDPNVHEAVQQVDSDTLPPGSVATVFQRGYTVGTRLLRPAMVAVVRGRPQATPADGGSAPGGAEGARGADAPPPPPPEDD